MKNTTTYWKQIAKKWIRLSGFLTSSSSKKQTPVFDHDTREIEEAITNEWWIPNAKDDKKQAGQN